MGDDSERKEGGSDLAITHLQESTEGKTEKDDQVLGGSGHQPQEASLTGRLAAREVEVCAAMRSMGAVELLARETGLEAAGSGAREEARRTAGDAARTASVERDSGAGEAGQPRHAGESSQHDTAPDGDGLRWVGICS